VNLKITVFSDMMNVSKKFVTSIFKEDEASQFIRNVGIFLLNCMASHQKTVIFGF
jgi:hypothetical protein